MIHTPPNCRNRTVSSILIHTQQPMLNSQQNFHWSFNSSMGNTTQLSQPVSLRGLPSYIQNEQQTLFINPIEIPPAWSSTLKCSQDWHSGLSPHPYEFIEKPKAFMYAIVVEVILPINTINH